MSTARTTLLKDVALSHPAAARVLESFHLDYCCGGKHTLGEACASAGLALDDVVAALAHASADTPVEPGIEKASLNALIRFIVDTHHAFTRTELSRIEALLHKVIARHGATHPELPEIGACFQRLQADLGPHLLKEENVLFPYIAALEHHRRGTAPKPIAYFGTIDNPLRQMQNEHEAVGTLLKEIRRLASDFTPPSDACPTYRSTFQALEGLETDLMRHIHLENHVLFPRAVELAARG